MIIQCCVCKMVKWGNGWRFDGRGAAPTASPRIIRIAWMPAGRTFARSARARTKQPLSA